MRLKHAVPTGERDPQDVWIPFTIQRQPNDVTCGPTCLQSLYRFHGESVDLQAMIAEIPKLADGGTLGVSLACHALRRGYRALIYTYNLHIFDPTWFPTDLAVLLPKLHARARAKQDPRLNLAVEAYLEFFRLGGRMRHRVLTPALLRRYLKRGVPILTGLNSTYLYQSQRERDVDGELVDDDVLGDPTAHFVVLCGYSRSDRSVLVADPQPPPSASGPLYRARIEHVVGAILLGIVTLDANFLLIEPAAGKTAPAEVGKTA